MTPTSTGISSVAFGSMLSTRMIKTLEDAIARMERLPADRKAYLAAVLDDVLGSEVVVVPDEHREAVLTGLAQVRDGKRASEPAMLALWTKCGISS